MRHALYALACIALTAAVVVVIEWRSTRRYDRWQAARRATALAYTAELRRAEARAARLKSVSDLADWTENMPDLWDAFEADYRTRSDAR